MANFNSVVLAGRLTQDPKLNKTNSDTSVTNVGLAVNDRINKRTLFIELEIFGRQAEAVVDVLRKGSGVIVQGKLVLDVWESSEGEKRQKIKVNVSSIEFLFDNKVTQVTEDRESSVAL